MMKQSKRKVLVWLKNCLAVFIASVMLAGLSSQALAAKPTPIDVFSDITIFPLDYLVETPPMSGQFPREDCVRDRANLNSLTCTANDVQLAQITLGSDTANTCTAGDVVTAKLNFNVKSTANIRYDWAFYTTTNPDADPLEGPGEQCLIWVGEITDDDPTTPNSQSVNGDLCTDVTKAQDAVFTDQEITFVCADKDGDTQVDLDYCATWNQNDDALCNSNGVIDPALLPTPGAPSKCNCETVTIPITVLASAPTLSKSITSGTPSSLTEAEIFAGTNTFSFDLNITNPNSTTNLVITSITDEFDGVDYDIPAGITTPPATLLEDDIYLISAIDNDGQCLESGTETITPGSTYTCTVKFVVHNLDLDDTNTSTPAVAQDYVDKFSVTWREDGLDADVGPSNDVTVSITDVPPILTVQKSANPTAIPESGVTDFDKVDYTVTFGSESGWDTITVISLGDTLLQNGKEETSGYLTGCSISGLDAGESPTCDYSVNLATAYADLNAGDVFKNTVKGTPQDEEGSSGGEESADATVQVNNVDPMVTLTKYVRAGTSSSIDPNDYDDVSTSVEEFQLEDLSGAPTVTYLFEVFNSSFEPFTIIDFVDFAKAPFSLNTPNTEYDPNLADTTPVSGDCSNLTGADKDVAVGEKVYCTLTFKVKGDEEDSVDNTAWVLVDDGEGTGTNGQDYDTDPAAVDFTPVTPALALDLGLEAIVEVTVTAASGNRETIDFSPFADILLVSTPEDKPILNGGITEFTVTNIDCTNATQTLGPNESYSCSFKVSQDSNAPTVSNLTVIEDSIKVQAQDDDGNYTDQVDAVTATIVD
ncbi:MAG: hypothetical protein V7735_19125 [Photobacterium frigidiphilum]|uniref:hypothetical protein n=1 Tax=Photobacterium frigidiphilum TaxID=264736 RepID=UPI0030031D78